MAGYFWLESEERQGAMEVNFSLMWKYVTLLLLQSFSIACFPVCVFLFHLFLLLEKVSIHLYFFFNPVKNLFSEHFLLDQ